MTGLREALAQRDRAIATDLIDMYGGPDGPDPAGWWRRAAALDRGEAVEVSGWELPHGTLPPGRHEGRYRVLPDGTIDELSPLR